jgi:hypothetical protein
MTVVDVRPDRKGQINVDLATDVDIGPVRQYIEKVLQLAM